MISDSPELFQLAEQICLVGRRMWDRGLVAANDGNISIRLPGDRILCTPSNVSKGFMDPHDMAICDMDANTLIGSRPATTEIRMHVIAYRARPDIHAVVHTHPPHAIAASLVYEQLPAGLIAEAELSMGPIPICEYQLPGTWEFANSLIPFFHTANVVILRHHGAVTIGNSLEQAYLRTESLEQYVHIVYLAHQWGGLKRLSDPQIEELAALRMSLGNSPNADSDKTIDLIIKRVRQRLGVR